MNIFARDVSLSLDKEYRPVVLNLGGYRYLEPDLEICRWILQHCKIGHFSTVRLIYLEKLTGS